MHERSKHRQVCQRRIFAHITHESRQYRHFDPPRLLAGADELVSYKVGRDVGGWRRVVSGGRSQDIDGITFARKKEAILPNVSEGATLVLALLEREVDPRRRWKLSLAIEVLQFCRQRLWLCCVIDSVWRRGWIEPLRYE